MFNSSIRQRVMKKKNTARKSGFFVPILATAGMEFFRRKNPEGEQSDVQFFD